MRSAVDEFQDLHFPLAGLDLSGAFSRQKPRQVAEGLWARTTPVAVNVQGYESNQRARGGSRIGIQKYIAAAVVEDWVVQDLNVVVTVDGAAT